jgi:hypothetical protein
MKSVAGIWNKTYVRIIPGVINSTKDGSFSPKIGSKN